MEDAVQENETAYPEDILKFWKDREYLLIKFWNSKSCGLGISQSSTPQHT